MALDPTTNSSSSLGPSGLFGLPDPRGNTVEALEHWASSSALPPLPAAAANISLSETNRRLAASITTLAKAASLRQMLR